MDVHRARFVPYPTSAISAVAFSRSSDQLSDQLSSTSSRDRPPRLALKLALGRANGAIEIWSSIRSSSDDDDGDGQWVQETIFPSDQRRGIDGLVWTREPDETDAQGAVAVGEYRLFSIASSPAVTEWDLAAGRPKKRSTGNFSEVWCFAAQPPPPPKKQSDADEETAAATAQDLIAGCGDGTLVLLSTADGDLQFSKFLARVSGKKARCMSVTYQTRERVVAGFADGVIRVYDTRTAAMLRAMSLGIGAPGAPKNTLVWQVRCLKNGDIVSGDSTGEMKFWDGKTYSLIQRVSGHKTDCLDLVTSADAKTLFSGSIDGRMAVYRYAINPSGRTSWSRSHQKRLHSGEVKAMAGFDGQHVSVVVSGGSDVSAILTPLREYGKEAHRHLPALPQSPPIRSASKARLLVSWWYNTITVWRINPHVADDLGVHPARKLVAKMTLDTDETIRDVSITEDGRMLAACTTSQIKTFQLRVRPGSEALSIRKLHLPEGIEPSGARWITFSPDGKWLAAATADNEVYIMRITTDPTNPKLFKLLDRSVELERRRRYTQSQDGFQQYERTITHLRFAPDSSVIVAADLSGCLDSWVLKGHEDPTAPAMDLAKQESDPESSDSDSDSSSSSDEDDSVVVFYGQHWADNPAGNLLPQLDSAPLVLSFRPPSDPSKPSPLANGNPGVHPTRNHPHAHSHALPRTGPHLLWVMTARHEMYEFDVLAGQLSAWSRRNPSAALPARFRALRERIMGAVWDVTAARQRLWLYGSTWLFMLDVGRDLSTGRGPSDKRRPSDAHAPASRPAKRPKPNSGAGAKVKDAFREGLPVTLRRLEDGVWTDVDVDRRRPVDDEDEDEDEESEDDDDDVDAQLRLSRVGDAPESDTAVAVHPPGHDPQSWLSFTYRPILGVVALGDRRADDDGPLEVVIVERPLGDR